MSESNTSFGIEEIDTLSIRDLTTQNLRSSELYLSVSGSTIVDFEGFGLKYGIGGKACMITVYDTNSPSNFASATGYYHYGDSLLSVPYGLSSCTQLNGVNITLSAAELPASYGPNKYGLKLDYVGGELLLRVLLF